MNTEFEKQWKALLLKLSEQFNTEADLIHVLYLIGIQEYGDGLIAYSKEKKLALIHKAACKMLSRWNYYKEDKNENKEVIFVANPEKTPPEDEEKRILLKKSILLYFNQIYK